jgi:integrase/recombinase XerD
MVVFRAEILTFATLGLHRPDTTVSVEEIVSFLRSLTDGRKQVTKHARYSHLRTLFNFTRQNLSPNLQNPCDAPMLKKLFRCGKPVQWDFLEKETVDEIIFRTIKVRNRLMLELMARGGMRIGEVLNLTPKDIDEQKLTIRDPKSGREEEVVFIPRRLAGRLKDYIGLKGIKTEEKIPDNL